MTDTHLIIDANTNEMCCLDCGERISMPQNVRLTTIVELLDGFKRAHDQMGCTEERYLKQKLLNDTEAVEAPK